jgi:hypothetical protein
LPVAKKDVKKIVKSEMSDKTIERFFTLLVGRKHLVQIRRGRYWIKDVYFNNIDNLKEKIKHDESKVKVVQYFLDALEYCESDTDWKLLEVFFAKMRDNKYAKE